MGFKHLLRNVKKSWTIICRFFAISFTCIKEKFVKPTGQIVFFDPSLDSYNLGDSIISYYCKKAVKKYVYGETVVCVQTHSLPKKGIRRSIPGAKQKFVFGTNLISNFFEDYSIWTMPFSLYGYRDVIAVGVGSGKHLDSFSKYTSFVYKKVFSKTALHAVRDQYTEDLFRKMGIHNVVYTGCTSLWGLTPEHCKRIPTRKAKNVLTTITDYDRDPKNDLAMLQILQKNYETVYFWVQGIDDLKYLSTLMDPANVIIVEHTLEAYEDVLKNDDIDYIGTRLHAGIHALNYGVRSLIVAIDNRATDMGSDVNLPIVQRATEIDQVESWIFSNKETQLNLPWDNIERWKNQFELSE